MQTHWVDELRRRGVLRVAALYVIGAWLVFQAADVFFPAWNIPDAALRYLLLAAALGFPIALFLGWRYDITASGIVLTPPPGDDHVVRGLGRRDYLALVVMLAASGAILYSVADGILASREQGVVVESGPTATQRLPDSVAVLPFSNISDDPSNAFFCDGISEEILNRLSQYRELTVMARSSSFLFRDSGLDAAAIADKLRVQYLLQGSVRKAGDNLRISASLVNADGVQVWSRTFDRQLRDVFAIQGEIAAAVSGQLASTVIEPGVAAARYDPLVEAYEQFLVGREYVRSRVPGWQEKAIEHFDQAIAMDPRYAAPHAGRAVAVFLREDLGGAGKREIAQRSVDAALALDPDDPDALAAQGLLHLGAEDARLTEAEDLLRRALALDPTVAGARGWLYNALWLQERRDEAAEVRAETRRLDPFEPRLADGVAMEHASRGEFEQAEQIYRRLLELPEPSELAYRGLATLYETYGRFADLVEIRQESIVAGNADGTPPYFAYAFLAQAYAYLGMRERADQWIDLASSGAPGELRIQLMRAYVHRLHGEMGVTAELIDSAVRATGVPVGRLPAFVRHVLGAARFYQGEYAEAVELLQSAFRPGQDQPSPYDLELLNVLVRAHRALGQEESADQVLRYVESTLLVAQERGLAQDPLSWYALAQCHAMLGRPGAALRALEEAVERGYRVERFLRLDTTWDGLRGEPPFRALLDRVSEAVAEQRAETERREAADPFPAPLNATLRGRNAAVEPTGGR